MTALNDPLNRPLRMALVGGGGTGFIGRVHLTAATLDRRAELVAGAFSSDPERSKLAAAEFGVASDRAYGSWQELIDTESQRPDDERIDFVSIATPNFTHFPIARAAISAGFNVVCDKPMTVTLDDAQELATAVEESGVIFVLTHNYSGYPLIRQARDMIEAGELGDVLAVRVNYIQGGLWAVKPGETPARGVWKSDPAKNGPLGTMSDIGTHAYQLARFTTGLKSARVSCRLFTFYPQRQLDDYGHVTVEFDGGAVASITVSQITHGRLNDLSLEVDGTTGSLSWRQEDPNTLTLRRFGEPARVYDRHPAAPYTTESARAACRIPPGHPEAFLEAFANVYRNGFDDMVARAADSRVDVRNTIYPNVFDGVEGVTFIERCAASHQRDGAWERFDTA